MSGDVRPFLVQHDGTVRERAGGAVIGRVYLNALDGWIAVGLTGERLPRDYPNGKTYAARAVWRASPYAAARPGE